MKCLQREHLVAGCSSVLHLIFLLSPPPYLALIHRSNRWARARNFRLCTRWPNSKSACFNIYCGTSKEWIQLRLQEMAAVTCSSELGFFIVNFSIYPWVWIGRLQRATVANYILRIRRGTKHRRGQSERRDHRAERYKRTERRILHILLHKVFIVLGGL